MAALLRWPGAESLARAGSCKFHNRAGTAHLREIKEDPRSLLSRSGLFTLRPTLPHRLRNALAALGRQLPLFAACRLCCLDGFGCLLRGCGTTGPSAARLVTGKQVARVLQASYLLIDAGQYFFYFQRTLPLSAHKNAQRIPL
jgi:hypothetical protein